MNTTSQNNNEQKYAQLLSEKQKLEAELARCSAELEALKKTHQGWDNGLDPILIGQLVSGIRHDLGNALTVIRLNMNLLTHYREDTIKFTRHMNSLQEGTRNIERAIIATRFFPVLETPPVEVCDLMAILNDSIAHAKSISNFLTVELHSPDEKATTTVNPAHLKLAFNAIFENAIESACELHADSPKVMVTVLGEDENWRVEFEDNGPGFTPDALQHGIEPGFSTRGEDVLGVKRMGMGLFVASTVVTRNGGELRLSNEPDSGAMIQLWLPRAEGEKPKKD